MDYKPSFSFIYKGKKYSNLDEFTLLSKKDEYFGTYIYKEETYEFMDSIEIRVESQKYINFDAYTYRVWLENKGRVNTSVISDFYAVDMEIGGEKPCLSGILGDHANQYRPYEIDLEKEDASFKQETGRATHIVFPYFLLETQDDSLFISLGWAGTWQANFTKDKFLGKGVNNFASYLKAGEKVRTPLVAFLSCGKKMERQEALNHWRTWYLKENMPSFEPIITNWLALDTGRPNSDGSISEYDGSWKRSMDKYYEQGLHMDVRWVDAGWYLDPESETVESDWWGTVGTWELDKEKWPNDSFKESIDYASERGAQTMLWFEPERVTNVRALSKNYGFDPSWILTDGVNGVILANLAIDSCVDYLANRINKVMDENGVHIYREDFNCDPVYFWNIGDTEEDRKGITENLYIQGHYRLWDMILEKSQAPFVDSCASGGGRNDLESMRRGVPFLRSDSDRTTSGLRLSMTTSFNHWIPVCGSSTKEAVGQLEAGPPDIYVLRASYLPILNYGFEYFHDKNIDYDLLRQGQKEWLSIKDYFFKDFYVLTPWHKEQDTDKWTSYMYFDKDKDEGVIQAFRQEECQDDRLNIKVRGVREDRYYDLIDIDGDNSFEKISGKDLIDGIDIHLQEKRSSTLIYIKHRKSL